MAFLKKNLVNTAAADNLPLYWSTDYNLKIYMFWKRISGTLEKQNLIKI